MIAKAIHRTLDKIHLELDVIYVNKNDGWTDYSMVDRSQNSNKREWVITRDECGLWSGQLLRSVEDGGDFEKSITIPANMVEVIVASNGGKLQ